MQPDPGAAGTGDEDLDKREESGVMPGESVPDEEPAQLGEADPDSPDGAPLPPAGRRLSPRGKTG